MGNMKEIRGNLRGIWWKVDAIYGEFEGKQRQFMGNLKEIRGNLRGIWWKSETIYGELKEIRWNWGEIEGN